MNDPHDTTAGHGPTAQRKELKQERAIRSRGNILLAAARAFAQRGYPAVTMLDVAELSGMTKGAVYFHFTNKEALALAVTTEFYKRLPAISDTVAELELPPVASVAELLLRTAAALRDEPMMKAGARLQIERGLIDVDLPIPFQDYTALITSWFRSALAAGELEHETPPATLARVLVSAFFGAQHMSWVLHDREDIIERTVEVLHAVVPCTRDPRHVSPFLLEQTSA
ncbi:TetR family transcriptional regulator [Streptomyces olivaceoviridis]|uniref:ScbR family autoregulator-binding transcription factor n=1 Tax=Streptomyces olivaceoviridis TaxID=1921 RepID=UPI001671C3AF|nr:ScbR family autoregulator-binding transcription factor [Streptomyces olivaceoviridis]GGY67652.1 TetR family transcriptional regulator [Streptomyces olivaceoviridis]